MKCLFVINDLARAGAEKQTVLLARGLKALGWSVSVVLIKERNDFSEQLAGASIPVSALRRTGKFDGRVVSRLREAIGEAAPDLVVSFLFLANLLTILASRGLTPRPRIVLSVRASYRRTLSGIERLTARLAHRAADLTLFNSMAALREEQAAFPRVLRSAYLPNAIELKRAEPVRWAEFGVAGSPVIVSVGQFAPVKGHRMLIEAFSSVAAAHPDTRLVLVGGGPEEEPLRELATRRALMARVSFLGHRQDPLPFMAGADVFVQPSLSEGMSNALMEAMSLGRCIVATRVGAAADLLEDGVEALLVPPTPGDLASAIDRALGDKELRDRLGAAARKKAEAFSIDRIASEFDAILRTLPPPL